MYRCYRNGGGGSDAGWMEVMIAVGVWKVCERKPLMMAKEGGRMFGKYEL